jgi:hypothetical protein
MFPEGQIAKERQCITRDSQLSNLIGMQLQWRKLDDAL